MKHERCSYEEKGSQPAHGRTGESPVADRTLWKNLPDVQSGRTVLKLRNYNRSLWAARKYPSRCAGLFRAPRFNPHTKACPYDIKPRGRRGRGTARTPTPDMTSFCRIDGTRA